MVTIIRIEIKDLTAEEVACIHKERTHAKLLAKMEKTLVDMLQLGNSAVSNGINKSSAWFAETIMVALCSRGVAEKLLSDCFERKSKSNKLMKASKSKLYPTH